MPGSHSVVTVSTYARSHSAGNCLYLSQGQTQLVTDTPLNLGEKTKKNLDVETALFLISFPQKQYIIKMYRNVIQQTISKA